MLDSIYHMILKLLKIQIFGEKTSRFCDLLRNIIMDVFTFLLHGVISLPDATSCDNIAYNLCLLLLTVKLNQHSTHIITRKFICY